jgi:hypothetical protein
MRAMRPVDGTGMSEELNPFAASDRRPAKIVDPAQPGVCQQAPQPRRCWTLRRLRILVATVAAATGAALVVTLAGSASGSVSTPASSLQGTAFTSAYPKGWTVRITRPIAGVTTYALTPSGVTLNSVGIPPAGSLGITIAEYSVATLAAEDPIPMPKDALKLLRYVIGTPRSATGESSSVALHETSLDGAAAAATTYTYTYGGVGNVQSDVVSRHGQELASIELNAEPALAPQGKTMLDAFIARWRWTSQGAVTDPAKLRYPAIVQTDFLGGCERAGKTAVCECFLRYVEARVPLATFMAFAVAAAKGHVTTPSWAIAAGRSCVNAGPVSAAPGSQAQSTSDTAAEELARTAEVAIETYATDHNGRYTGATPAALKKIETTIPITAGNGNAWLSSVRPTGTGRGYTITATSTTGDTYSITRTDPGLLSRTCVPVNLGGCSASGTW